MKSREERKHEAQSMSLWLLAVVAGLLLVYVLVTGSSTWVGAIAPLITASAALGGVYLGSRLSQHQRREDELRRRRALATFLLGEIQVLYWVLKDIDQAFHMKALHRVAIAPFYTAVYEQAGGDRLLFQGETAQVLAQFYSLVYTLRMELTEFQGLTPEQRAGREDALRFRTLYIAECIQEAMHKLSAEGGAWPLAVAA